MHNFENYIHNSLHNFCTIIAVFLNFWQKIVQIMRVTTTCNSAFYKMDTCGSKEVQCPDIHMNLYFLLLCSASFSNRMQCKGCEIWPAIHHTLIFVRTCISSASCSMSRQENTQWNQLVYNAGGLSKANTRHCIRDKTVMKLAIYV